MHFNSMRKNQLERLLSCRGITLQEELFNGVKYFIIVLLITFCGCTQLTPRYFTASAYERALILYNKGMLMEAKEKTSEIRKGEQNYKKAQALLMRIDILSSRLAEKHMELGEEYEKAALYSLAADEYRTALKFDPANPSLRKKLELAAQGRTSLQKEAVKDVNPEVIATKHYKQGVILFDSKQFAQAIDEFNIVLQLIPAYKDTEELLAEARKQRDEIVALHLKKGIDYFQKEELELAIKEWDIALELDPFHKTVLDYKARAEAIIEKMKGIQERKR